MRTNRSGGHISFSRTISIWKGTAMSKITLSVYITAQRVTEYGRNAEELNRMISDIKDIGARKVFIETWRGGGFVEEEILRDVRNAFESEGFETATGIMPVRGRDALLEGTDDWDSHKTLGGNSRWGADICYSRPWSRDEIRKAIQRGAAVFDEYIIDDALCTQCTCTYCREKRGNRSWFEYRQDLLLDVCRDDIVGAAREVNPDIHMILKFPQWYDRLHHFGYDTARQPELFDATWIGTETRDPDTPDYGYTPQYEAFFNVRWHRNSSPNLEGTWFDYIECDPSIYVEQAYQSVLGGATNLTLFCYTEPLFRGNGYLQAALKAAMPNLERIAERIDGVEPSGITAVRPHKSQAWYDGYVFDSLGMIGMPLVPVAEWPERTPKAVLLTDHSAHDSALTEKVRAVVNGGGTVFLTAALLALRDDDEELKQLAGYEKDGWSQLSSWPATRYRIGSEIIEVDEAVPYRFDLRAESAEVLAEVGGVAHHRTEWSSVVTRKEHEGGGAVIVLNINGASDADFRMDENLNVPIPLQALSLPVEVVNVIQREVGKATGQGVIAPPKVAYYPFESGDVVVQNFRDESVVLKAEGTEISEHTRLEFGAAKWSEKDGGIVLQPRSVVLISG